MSAAGPLRGPGNGGGCAAAVLAAPAKAYGSAAPASRVLRIALRATALRAALDPGDHGGPWEQEKRAGRGLPHPASGRKEDSPCRADHHNRSLHAFRGTPALAKTLMS